MPKVFQPTGNTVADAPTDKSFIHLYIDGDGMFCCRMNNIIYYTRVGKFKWQFMQPHLVLTHEQGGILQATTPYGYTVDVMMETAYVTEFSRRRRIRLYWDHDEIGPFKYHKESRLVNYEDIFVSVDGGFHYKSKYMYPWYNQPAENVYSMTYNKIKIATGIENPQHARPFGKEEQILDDSCWVGKELRTNYWYKPTIKNDRFEVVFPSIEYDDVKPAHETNKRSSFKSFM